MNEIQKYIYNEVGNKPTYNEFYTAFLNAYRSLHPNSTSPKNGFIAMCFEQYNELNTIIGY